MPFQTFEDIWRALHNLEGKTIDTLVVNRRNRIVKFLPTKMIRQTESDDGKSWNEAQPVPKSAFRNIWQDLITTGVCEVRGRGWRIAAACLVRADLGVEKIHDRPLTLGLTQPRRRTRIGYPREAHQEEPETPVENPHITVDPNICSGKPCIRGTRIMVTNILGMMAGEYSIERVLESYPELTKADVSAALEYASQIIDEDKIIVRR